MVTRTVTLIFISSYLARVIHKWPTLFKVISVALEPLEVNSTYHTISSSNNLCQLPPQLKVSQTECCDFAKIWSGVNSTCLQYVLSFHEFFSSFINSVVFKNGFKVYSMPCFDTSSSKTKVLKTPHLFQEYLFSLTVFSQV